MTNYRDTMGNWIHLYAPPPCPICGETPRVLESPRRTDASATSVRADYLLKCDKCGAQGDVKPSLIRAFRSFDQLTPSRYERRPTCCRCAMATLEARSYVTSVAQAHRNWQARCSNCGMTHSQVEPFGFRDFVTNYHKFYGTGVEEEEEAVPVPPPDPPDPPPPPLLRIVGATPKIVLAKRREELW